MNFKRMASFLSLLLLIPQSYAFAQAHTSAYLEESNKKPTETNPPDTPPFPSPIPTPGPTPPHQCEHTDYSLFSLDGPDIGYWDSYTAPSSCPLYSTLRFKNFSGKTGGGFSVPAVLYSAYKNSKARLFVMIGDLTSASIDTTVNDVTLADRSKITCKKSDLYREIMCDGTLGDLADALQSGVIVDSHTCNYNVITDPHKLLYIQLETVENSCIRLNKRADIKDAP